MKSCSYRQNFCRYELLVTNLFTNAEPQWCFQAKESEKRCCHCHDCLLYPRSTYMIIGRVSVCCGRFLCTLHIFDQCHYGWICDAHWNPCFSGVQIFEKHHRGWVRDAHWGQCHLSMHVFGAHHVAQVIETHFQMVESRIREQVLRQKAGNDDSVEGKSVPTVALVEAFS